MGTAVLPCGRAPGWKIIKLDGFPMPRMVIFHFQGSTRETQGCGMFCHGHRVILGVMQQTCHAMEVVQGNKICFMHDMHAMCGMFACTSCMDVVAVTLHRCNLQRTSIAGRWRFEALAVWLQDEQRVKHHQLLHETNFGPPTCGRLGMANMDLLDPGSGAHGVLTHVVACLGCNCLANRQF